MAQRLTNEFVEEIYFEIQEANPMPMTTKEQQAEWDQEYLDLGHIVQREVNRDFAEAGDPKDGGYALSTEMLRSLGRVVARRQNKAWLDGHEGKVNGIHNRVIVPPQVAPTP